MSAAVTEDDHASPLRVIGLFLAFCACAGMVVFLLIPKTVDLEGEEALRTMFSAVAPGAPEPLADGAFRARGQTVVTLGPDAERSLESVTFVRYPASRARSVMNDQVLGLSFESKSSGGWGGGGRGRGRGRGGRSGGSGGEWGESKKGPKLQDAGPLDWHGYETRFARLRHSTGEGSGEDGAFYDSIRVILTTRSQCLIGYLRFEPGVPGTAEAAREVLAQFEPLDEE